MRRFNGTNNTEIDKLLQTTGKRLNKPHNEFVTIEGFFLYISSKHEKGELFIIR
jgi:hypothetical protein